MTEIERIQNNTNGELPSGPYDILRIRKVADPKDELETFKQTVKTILENIQIDAESRQWGKLLPKKLVAFTNQLEEQDWHKDDLLSNIANIVDSMQDIKDWEWYSSKLTSDGFEVFMIGRFRGIFLPILHHQGLPHASLFIERGGKEYPTRALTDVLTYKQFDPKTYELK